MALSSKLDAVPAVDMLMSASVQQISVLTSATVRIAAYGILAASFGVGGR